MSQPKEWYFKALKAALEGPRYEHMCTNLVQYTEELTEAGMTAGVDTMSWWWEPLTHTKEDVRKHLHRESLDGAAAENTRPTLKCRRRFSEHMNHTQEHELMPCSKQRCCMPVSREGQLVWDTGSTCYVHTNNMQCKESDVRSCHEVCT